MVPSFTPTATAFEIRQRAALRADIERAFLLSCTDLSRDRYKLSRHGRVRGFAECGKHHSKNSGQHKAQVNAISADLGNDASASIHVLYPSNAFIGVEHI
jgi:hypothetical protein